MHKHFYPNNGEIVQELRTHLFLKKWKIKITVELAKDIDLYLFGETRLHLHLLEAEGMLVKVKLLLTGLDFLGEKYFKYTWGQIL